MTSVKVSHDEHQYHPLLPTTSDRDPTMKEPGDNDGWSTTCRLRSHFNRADILRDTSLVILLSSEAIVDW